MGIEVTYIRAGKFKAEGMPTESLTPEAFLRIQNTVDGVYEIFTSHVATNRAITVEEVKNTEALTYSAAEAMSLGLVDAVGSLDEALIEFSERVSKLTQGVDEMDDKDNKGPDTMSLVANAKIEGVAEGIKSERTRLSAIMSLPEASERGESALKMALSTDLTVEQARDLLSSIPATAKVATPEPSANTATRAFQAAMQGTPNPELGQLDTESLAGAEDEADNIMASIGRKPKKRNTY